LEHTQPNLVRSTPERPNSKKSCDAIFVIARPALSWGIALVRDEVNEFNIRRRLVQIFQSIDESAGRRAGSAKKDPMAWLNGEHSQ